MSKIGIFMADGCEEIEGLTVVDVVRRAKMEIVMLSITGKKEVTSSHGVTFLADALAEETGYEDLDGIVLPGGMPGTRNLAAHEGLCGELLKADKAGKRLAAICAGPSVLGGLGILEGRKATCYPGFEGELKGAEYTRQGVVTDGNVTTARGLGYALDLGIELLALLTDREHAGQIKDSIQYDQIPM